MVSLIPMALRAALCETIRASSCIPAEANAIRLPARGAAAGLYIKEGQSPLEAVLKFSLPCGEAFGVPLIRAVRTSNSHLLFDLTDALYSRLVSEVLSTLPLPDSDCGNPMLNRMLTLSRQPLFECPSNPDVQSAFLECLCLGSGCGLASVERTLRRMFWGSPPANRQTLVRSASGVCGAAARLLFAFISSERN